ncbi:C-type lectin domain family 4 member F-like isoform X2 [Dermochelys coriacea]|uniref:C-type lectin domain family 4 member F-like isoform X2 n=1 Tax=Dermochelys coriacea TaxID=27794 RepID=UPI001CA8B7E1|nr:C-type lectin domain family 4 member F-like isoform X2 [Dermochelys coriacea]
MAQLVTGRLSPPGILPISISGPGLCHREALTQQAAERTYLPAIGGSAQREGRRMARENIYENLEVMEAAPQPKGNPTETSVPWRHRAGGIVTAVLPLLTLVALASSLLAVTFLYFQAQSKLQAVEEAIQKLQVSLRPDNASDTSAKELDSLQLLDEEQARAWMLKDQLDNVSAARAAVQGHCSDMLTKLSRGWSFYSGNLHYFSQEKKPWDEAEQFCVSQDSHLTSVSSQVEQEFLSKETKGQGHWIGLTDRETESSWHWVDGTEFRADASREFWEENQPDNWDQRTEGREDCVEIHPSRLNLWNDANCIQLSRWICKQAHR